ncbi:MAG: hypothetical protein WCN92_11355 [Eubacteriales bacterium]
MTGKWKQHELWDDTYTFDDLQDILELIEVENENSRRAYAWAERDVRT